MSVERVCLAQRPEFNSQHKRERGRDRVRSHRTDWENIFVKHVFDRGLESKIFKELLKFNNEKTKLRSHQEIFVRENTQMTRNT
jgi:hypothetical protein